MNKVGMLFVIQLVILTACSDAQGSSILSTKSTMNQSVSSVAEEHKPKKIQEDYRAQQATMPECKRCVKL